MIEMHLGEEPLGDDDDDYQWRYPGRLGEFWRLAFSAPSLAIASVLIGLASLTVSQSADDIGETALFSSKSHNPSTLTELRVSSAVRLVIAVVALVMAVAAGLRAAAADEDVDDEDVDDERPRPSWLGAVAGAAFVVSLVAVIVSGVAFGYALHAHVGPSLGGI
jgi:hypothetical protein